VSKTVSGAKRLSRIPPYLFAEIDRKVQEKKRAGVDVISLGIGDPDLPTLGSKDGISHVPLALVDPGDVVLAPDPGYTVYVTGAIMAGADPFPMPLTAENRWLPDLDAIPPDVAQRARLMWLNYPNNPTAAVAERDFLVRAVEFCQRHRIVL